MALARLEGLAMAAWLATGVGCVGDPELHWTERDAGPPPGVTCAPGGTAGLDAWSLGPEGGSHGDLWRVLGSGAGEGQSFTIPRAGVILRVDAQIFASHPEGEGVVEVFRWCEGWPVRVARTAVPASSFPAYVLATVPDARFTDQDLRETAFWLEPPVEVAAGDRVDAIFHAEGASLVSSISMDDEVPNSHAVFPNGAPGLTGVSTTTWDYHARLSLRSKFSRRANANTARTERATPLPP